MKIESLKQVALNEEVTLFVNESTRKIAIQVPMSGQQVVLSFEEYQLLANAMQLMALERGMATPETPKAPENPDQTQPE